MTEEKQAQFDRIFEIIEDARNHLARAYSSLDRSEKMILEMSRKAKESK